MSEIIQIRCQWCGLELHTTNTDFTCGINTKGLGHKWLAGPFEKVKDAEISRLTAENGELRKALGWITEHKQCDWSGCGCCQGVAQEALEKNHGG